MNSKYLLFGLIALASCSDDQLLQSDTSTGYVKKIVMSADDYQFGQQTRSGFIVDNNRAKFTWRPGDVVGVFPIASSVPDGQIANEGAQVSFPISNVENGSKAYFDGGGWALRPNYTYAAYYPLQKKWGVDKTKIPVTYKGQTAQFAQTDENGHSIVDFSDFDYMTAQATRANDTGYLDFQFKHVGALVIMDVLLPYKDVEYTNIILSSKDWTEKLFLLDGLVDLKQKPVDANGKPLAQQLIPVETSHEITVNLNGLKTTCRGQAVTLYFLMPPTKLAGRTLEVHISYKTSGFFDIISTHVYFPKDLVAGGGYHVAVEPVNGALWVQTPGTLSQLYAIKYPQGTDDLRLVGTINDDDLNFIKSLTQLKHLNMSYVEIVGSRPKQLPAGLLDGMKNLREFTPPYTVTGMDADFLKNFPNASNLYVNVFPNLADSISITQEGDWQFGRVTVHYIDTNDSDGYKIPLFNNDSKTNTLSLFYDDMVCFPIIQDVLNGGSVLNVNGKLSEKDFRAFANFTESPITSLTFENVEGMPSDTAFVGFNHSEACDLVIPEAWQSLVSGSAGKPVLGGAVWKTVKFAETGLGFEDLPDYEPGL